MTVTTRTATSDLVDGAYRANRVEVFCRCSNSANAR